LIRVVFPSIVGRLRSRAGFALAAAALVVLLALVAAGHGPGSRAGAGATGLALDQIGSFQAPVYVDSPPRKPKLLFVVEQPGTIRVLRNGKKLSRPFLDISDRVQFAGEEGLLSIAFHPKYKKKRRFFVYYVNNDGDLQVDGFKTRKKNPVRANRKSRRRVIKIPHPGEANHNGGQLQFGPDKLLYLAPGDGGGSGDPDGSAQSKNSLLGKLLRIKPKRKRGYKVPKSNPFVGEAGRDEIYSLGLRNPYRFSFDSKTGDIFIGDVGQGEWEEIDHETLASAKGANFGWNIFEGNHPFAGGPAPPNYEPPIHEYATHVGGTTAVIGGFVARDPSLTGYVGRYFYSDNGAGFIRSLNPYGPLGDADTGLHVSFPGGFGDGPGGKLYVTSLGGPVYRIVSD
jgi:glucose/arabinose dehydrogenase